MTKTPDKIDGISDFKKAIIFCIDSHCGKPISPPDAVRFIDGITPYATHPIWCAMTLLTEAELSSEFRHSGYLALLWHDILEDTTATLPAHTPECVKSLIHDMTFKSLSEEKISIWSKSKEVKLLKLYDKVSNLLDGDWMSDEKWNAYVSYTKDLTASVIQHYGDSLNIVKISLSIAVERKNRPDS